MTRKPRSPAPERRRRGRQPLPDGERKDHLVQTRVPEVLDDTLREAARRSRISVSQLVRNVLENTFELVDEVTALGQAAKRDATALGQAVKRDATTLGQAVKRDAQRVAASVSAKRPPRSAKLDEIVAWQEVVCNRPAACASCGRYLVRGDRAFLGLEDTAASTTPRAKLWLCAGCAAAL
jgi:hypothetical protein